MSRLTPIDRLMSGEPALEQRHNGVLVTYPDGASRLVLNAKLSREKVKAILYAASRPKETIR